MKLKKINYILIITLLTTVISIVSIITSLAIDFNFWGASRTLSFTTFQNKYDVDSTVSGNESSLYCVEEAKDAGNTYTIGSKQVLTVSSENYNKLRDAFFMSTETKSYSYNGITVGPYDWHSKVSSALNTIQSSANWSKIPNGLKPKLELALVKIFSVPQIAIWNVRRDDDGKEYPQNNNWESVNGDNKTFRTMAQGKWLDIDESSVYRYRSASGGTGYSIGVEFDYNANLYTVYLLQHSPWTQFELGTFTGDYFDEAEKLKTVWSGIWSQISSGGAGGVTCSLSNATGTYNFDLTTDTSKVYVGPLKINYSGITETDISKLITVNSGDATGIQLVKKSGRNLF